MYVNKKVFLFTKTFNLIVHFEQKQKTESSKPTNTNIVQKALVCYGNQKLSD